jgi:hypothetical protein
LFSLRRNKKDFSQGLAVMSRIRPISQANILNPVKSLSLSANCILFVGSSLPTIQNYNAKCSVCKLKDKKSISSF